MAHSGRLAVAESTSAGGIASGVLSIANAASMTAAPGQRRDGRFIPLAMRVGKQASI
jgi:hypothetical protein